MSKELDCVIIGYNEVPFQKYEKFLMTAYGEDSEAYRDLRFSFVNVGNQKLDYVNLLNYALDGTNEIPGRPSDGTELKSGDIPNLAAVYLTSFLARKGFEAKFVNLFQNEKDKLIEYLRQDPVCVAITTTFYVVNLPVTEMVEFIRGHNQRTKIVVGGPLISNHIRNYQGDELKAALSDMGADIYVAEGQGELTLAAIVNRLKNSEEVSDIPNLMYFEDEQLRTSGVIPENSSLDENCIDWSSFPDEDLGHTIQTRTARSCAFNCSFCNYPTRAGKLTLASLDTIERELDSIAALDNVSNVVFIDDTFNVPLPRFKEICNLMIRKKYGFNWFSYFRCSNSDEEAFDLLAESGCKGVFLGIESGSPRILKNMNKAATVELYAEGIKRLRKHNVLTFGSFIVGFPGETDETVQETIDFIKETRPSYFRAQLWYCEPGTPIQRQREKYNISGEGFVWTHASMSSLEAMDHIDRLFLTINESQWLPQWSFDFWIIPYLLGKGISFDLFDEFMRLANKLLALDIAYVHPSEKNDKQQKYLRKMTNIFAGRYQMA